MKITIFTSNHRRHNHYINELLKKGHEVFAVIEATTLLSGVINDHFKSSEIFRAYFDKVLNSEKKIFPNDTYIKNLSNLIVLKCGDLSYLTHSDLHSFLNSDCYLTFGCSYIKGWLAEFLIDKYCLNIHMGVSPFYRGANCNFWAAYDLNYEYVGGTIHFLAKGLDSGPIIDVVFPSLKNCENAFDFTMKSVKSSQEHLINILDKKSDFRLLKANAQNKELLKRYTLNKDFNESVALEFIKRDDNLDSIQSCLNRVKMNQSHPLFGIYKPFLV